MSFQQLHKCRKVYQSLLHVAIPELIRMANSLIAPVRLGVCRPAAPFSCLTSDYGTANDEATIGEELFDVEPLPRRPSTPSSVTEATHTARNHVSRAHLDSESTIERHIEQLEVADPQPSGDVGELHDIEVRRGSHANAIYPSAPLTCP